MKMNENEDILFSIAVKNQCKAVNRNTKLILKPQNLYLYVYIVKETLNISSTTELMASLKMSKDYISTIYSIL